MEYGLSWESTFWAFSLEISGRCFVLKCVSSRRSCTKSVARLLFGFNTLISSLSLSFKFWDKSFAISSNSNSSCDGRREWLTTKFALLADAVFVSFVWFLLLFTWRCLCLGFGFGFGLQEVGTSSTRRGLGERLLLSWTSDCDWLSLRTRLSNDNFRHSGSFRRASFDTDWGFGKLEDIRSSWLFERETSWSSWNPQSSSLVSFPVWTSGSGDDRFASLILVDDLGRVWYPELLRTTGFGERGLVGIGRYIKPASLYLTWPSSVAKVGAEPVLARIGRLFLPGSVL